jgi:ribonuclease VapC
MVVDSSALVAILLAEPGFERLREAMITAADVIVPAPVLVEAGMVMLSRTGAGGLTDLDDLLERSGARVLALSEGQARAAVAAFDRYGKGRHPAGLNFGDCMAYAVAMAEGVPLLFTGGDFARTDVVAAQEG